MKKILVSCSLLMLLLFTGCFLNTAENIQLEKRDEIVYRIGEKKPFTGTMKNFYSNGKIAKEINYIDGFENGDSISYHSNGQIQEKGRYIHGKKEGIWEMYYSDGRVINRITFKDDDSKYGEEYNYDNNKNLELKVTWNAGNDKFIYEHYKDGKIVNKIIQGNDKE